MISAIGMSYDAIGTRQPSEHATELLVYNIQPYDSGAYTCMVGTLTQTVNVNVNGEGKIFFLFFHQFYYLFFVVFSYFGKFYVIKVL